MTNKCVGFFKVRIPVFKFLIINIDFVVTIRNISPKLSKCDCVTFLNPKYVSNC